MAVRPSRRDPRSSVDGEKKSKIASHSAGVRRFTPRRMLSSALTEKFCCVRVSVCIYASKELPFEKNCLCDEKDDSGFSGIHGLRSDVRRITNIHEIVGNLSVNCWRASAFRMSIRLNRVRF